jgi:hypothetical protein
MPRAFIIVRIVFVIVCAAIELGCNTGAFDQGTCCRVDQDGTEPVCLCGTLEVEGTSCSSKTLDNTCTISCTRNGVEQTTPGTYTITASCSGNGQSAGACGQRGQACCTGATCSNGCCDSTTNRCIETGATCDASGTTCSASGECTECGAIGQVCCGYPKKPCSDTSACCDGTSLNGACVAEGTSCVEKTSLARICKYSGAAGFGTCQQCGSEAEPCCAGKVCKYNFLVCGASSLCDHCGDLHDPCCRVGAPCKGTYTCIRGKCEF